MKYVEVTEILELNHLGINAIKEVMEEKAARAVIGTSNWRAFPYRPFCIVQVARSSQSLLLHYAVRGFDLVARHIADGSPVYTDSCVEFFVKLPNSSYYYNFEFNCIGTCSASKRLSREKSTPFTPDQYQEIKRHSSIKKKPVEMEGGIHNWELSVEIPFTLMGLKADLLPDKLLCNFYKCADLTAHPHYLSWNPVGSPSPDFHRPEYFGEMLLL